MSVWAGRLLRIAEAERIFDGFQSEVNEQLALVEQATRSSFDLLFEIRALVLAGGTIDPVAFRRIAEDAISRRRALQHLTWTYLDATVGTPELSYTAAGREPADIYAEPQLGDAIRAARDGYGVVAIPAPAPPFAAGHVVALLGIRQLAAAGEADSIAMGIFDITTILDEVFSGPEWNGFDVRLLESDGGKLARDIYRRPSALQAIPADQMRYTRALREIGGFLWRVEVTPTQAYVAARRTPLSWVVTGAGSLLFVLIAGYLQFLARRNRAIKEIVAEQTAELRRINAQLDAQARIDPLTRVPNRRGLDERLAQVWAQAAMDGTAVAVAMIDIDFFKQYNDSYGHSAGDDCLRRVAARLLSALRRSGDFLARYGGEEFVAVLPETGAAGLPAARRFCESVRSLGIPHNDSRAADIVTISAGVAWAEPGRQHDMTIARLLELADRALYRAKDSGRDQAVLYDPTATVDD